MLKRPSPWLAAAIGLLATLPFPHPVRSQVTPAPQKLSFDVASVHPALVQAGGGEGSTRAQIQPSPDGLILSNISLGEMIEWAYSLQHSQLSGPAILEKHRYDVRARASARVPEKSLRLMLQDLLATRFDLKLHREQKPTSVYELTVVKGGSHLPPDKSATLPPSYPRERFPRVLDGSFLFTNVTMPEFAQQLTELRGIDLPVIDRTGINGIYDITLKSAAAAMLQPDGPSLLTLIHEQLGLKLVAAKDPIEVVVVDHADEPAPD